MLQLKFSLRKLFDNADMNLINRLGGFEVDFRSCANVKKFVCLELIDAILSKNWELNPKLIINA